jgi:dipeptidyl aminopeptidase/acylaminoacyl peptidase
MNMLAYIRDLTNDEEFCVTDKPGWYIPGYWSPDSRKINCSQLVTLTDYTIWLLDINRKEMRQVISPIEEKSRNIVGPWLPDGQGFYVITDLKREYSGLAFYDIGKSKLEWILTPEHDIESVELSQDGKVLVWTENVNGYSNIFIKNTQNGEVQEIPEISKKGVIGHVKISPDGKRIGVIMTTPGSPSNKRVDRLTESMLGNIPDRKMIQPELIKYKSFDGLEIEALLYRARQNIDNNDSDNKFGTILSIHGGPTAQERSTYAYAGFYQYLANNGIAVLAPNFRGSTGYGKSFEKKIYHDWGGNELKDLEYAIK